MLRPLRVWAASWRDHCSGTSILGCIAQRVGATHSFFSRSAVLLGAVDQHRRQVRSAAREHQLAYFHDGPDAILVASYLGEPKNPHWYHDLKAHPECQLGDEDFVAVEVTDPDDYERLYAFAEHVCVNYGDYRAKAAAVGRRIPVSRRLQPASAG